MDPQMLAAMLMQNSQQPQNQAVGGMQPKPGAAGAGMQGAGDLMKIMMMKRLMQGQQQQQANGMLPQTNQMIQQQMPGMTNAINPNMPPPPGLSQ